MLPVGPEPPGLDRPVLAKLDKPRHGGARGLVSGSQISEAGPWCGPAHGGYRTLGLGLCHLLSSF